jgi:hypothetical protein
MNITKAKIRDIVEMTGALLLSLLGIAMFGAVLTTTQFLS